MDNYGTILLVEDDISLAQWVAEYLTEQGYHVHVCHRGDEVVGQVKTLKPQLILLDIMLPGLDGISVCRELRSFYQAPIIMLTARDDEMDEVIGLEVGASDYIMKPVRPRALLARIKSALRLTTQSSQSHKQHSIINVGALSINSESRSVKLNDIDINISSAEYLLLHYLASNAGQVVSRDAVKLGAQHYLVSSNDDAMKSAQSAFDVIIDTVPVKHDLSIYTPLLDIDGTLVIVGQVGPVDELSTVPLLMGRRRIAGSLIGGIAQTQQMLDFCGEHNVLPECEMINIDEINTAYERMEKSDVRYRFVIDMASLSV